MVVQKLIEQYGSSENVKINGNEIPVINIPMMPDEQWNELARQQAVKNYIRENGKEPESVESALEWQREWVKSRQPV